MRKSGKFLLRWTFRLGRSFSVAGLLLGTLFFAASLTPSLIPRTYVLQGVLSGCSFAAGYGLGVLARWLWGFLELPLPRARTDLILKAVAATACAMTAAIFLWQASEWQNSIRRLMDMEPVTSSHPLEVGAIAVLVFALIVLLARLFRLVLLRLSDWFARFIPPRVAAIVGTAIAVSLAWSIVDGVFFRLGLRAVDASFRQLDALVEEGVSKPDDPGKTGSEASLVSWENLGRAGRRFISTAPTRRALDAFADGDALQPIRVFVGLNSEETAQDRARLALEELKRVDAFDRSVLVVVTPIGTGGIDRAAMNTLEFLHRGDVASVAVQYSYLTSWLSLLIEPGYGAETSRALFNQVYEYWTTLPEDERPRLYLHGLSLGALNSDLSLDIYDVIADPIHGALWSGPPFSTPTWRQATEERNPGSPAWLPRFRDGSVIRFTNQANAARIPNAEWGPIRMVYLQYASDPVTFFEPRALYREPEWMAGRRGPDVSQDLQWFPIVTLLQLALDMTNAIKAPVGHGHVYAPEDYIDAWIEVTQPEDWSPEEVERLKDYLGGRRLSAREQ